MKSFYSPLRYPGGKTCNFNFVSHLLIENNLVGIDYIEPYAGGAGLALKLLIEEYVGNIYINDYDKSIYCFWNSIINYTDDFCKWILDVDINIENWKKYKKIQENKDNENCFELAKSTFFLNRCNISGVLKGGVIGGVNQSGKYKINARFNKKYLIEKIIRISRFRNRIFLYNEDGIKFVNKLNKEKSNFFIYLDPPYYQKGANLYLNFYQEEDHFELSKLIPQIRKYWIMSYDNCNFINNLYRNNIRIRYNLKQSTSNRIGDEILIISNNLNFDSSKKFLANNKIL